MKQNDERNTQNTQTPAAEPAHAPHGQKSFTSSGIGQLAAMMNSSPQARKLAQLQADIANSSRAQHLRQLSAAIHRRPSVAPAMQKTEGNVAQLVQIEPKGINGLTHLVEMTAGGHIYNKDWSENEREEVRYGDLLQVDLDNAWYSRRGINQETNWQRDKTGEQTHLWVEARSLNGSQLGADRYVRNEMLIDPVVIHLPRAREGLDGAVDGVVSVLSRMIEQTCVDTALCRNLIGEVELVKKSLHITSAPVEINLGKIGTDLEATLRKIESLEITKEVGGFKEALREGLDRLREVYAAYKAQKKQVTTGGKIGRMFLAGRGIQGIDLGGTGLKEGMLDLNIDDSVNDRNLLVLGDAMNLSRSFEPDCTDSVIAELLPLVDMESAHTVEARVLVISRVLAGVRYICPGGTASIKFNDNSDPGRVNERMLLELAATYGFTLELQQPVVRPQLSQIAFGVGLLKPPGERGKLPVPKGTDGPKPTSPSMPPLPQEGLYRYFTFKK